MFTLMWITEKELERVTENKGDEFRSEKNIEIQSSGEKMRNASGQQGENDRREKKKKCEHEHRKQNTTIPP